MGKLARHSKKKKENQTTVPCPVRTATLEKDIFIYIISKAPLSVGWAAL
jgi:hypothetical protein